MKGKLKKWHIALMSFMALFIAVFASLFSLKATTVDEEATPEELVDNWSLDVVFYDSSVDGGNTPLTEINWDASDGGYGQGASRVITVQINYKNSNAVTTYEPGDLKIMIPNLIYGTASSSGAGWITEAIVGANDSTHTGYAWNFSSGSSPTASYDYYTFTNANTFSEKSNFEGSIQIQYTITPKEEYSYTNSTKMQMETTDECVHNHTMSLQAILQKTENTDTFSVNSNIINFNYTRTYYHPWQQRTHTITKTASKITSLDGMPAGDYYWVKYQFTLTNGYYDPLYPYLGASFYISDNLPSDCIVLDYAFNELDLENGLYEDYSFSSNGTWGYRYEYIYVGYPKSIYNEEAGNLTITNHVDLYVKQGNETEYKNVDDDEVTINLADFEFVYTGNLYGISKTTVSAQGYFYSDLLLNPEFIHGCYQCNTGHATTELECNMTASAIYTGTPLTVKVGDDLLYINGADGNYRKLTDDEYWFTTLRLPYIKNNNGINIGYAKYESALYVRYANDTSFTKYLDLSTKKAGDIISFESSEKVVAYYIQVNNLTESFIMTSSYAKNKDFGIHIKPINNIANTGKIYNFANLRVYFEDENGNLVLQNEPLLENYATITAQDNIAQYDIDTYGHYVQRDEAYHEYSSYAAPNLNYGISAYKDLPSAPVQDEANEQFIMKTKLGFYNSSDSQFHSILSDSIYMNSVYYDYIDEIDILGKYEVYDLLPLGMELISSETEIIDSIAYNESTSKYYSYFYKKDGTQAFSSHDQFEQFLKNHSTIEITENWNNTGRTKIEWIIDFSSEPLFDFYPYRGTRTYGYIEFDTIVSYDSYLEYGAVWTNNCYATGYYNTGKKLTTGSVADNGTYDADFVDVNENGDTTETLSYQKDSVSITSVVSTHQDVTTYVKTDQSNYSTGIVNASCSSEYEYKLRVRTGSSDVTNLILYTNLEEAQPERTRWKGEFLGYDTSYATNKGYNVKTYYSENPSAGNLYNTDGLLNTDWKEYIFDTPAIYAQGLEVTFNSQFKTESVSYDYVEIYYVLNGTTYKLGKWGGTDLAGKTLQIPSNDFYLYWRTDGSSCSYYGFSIDSITYKKIENTNTTTGTIPSYTPEEITGNTYPDSAFGSYTHGNYGNNVNKVWHYTYTGEKELIQEAIQGTDKSKVKSLAFEYLDANGNAAIL